MPSTSNDISRDITSLLSPESRTPEMEELIRVVSTVRPQVHIDRTYQKELRSRLMSKTSKRYIFSLPIWTGVVSTVFAALIGVFALSSIWTPREVSNESDPIGSMISDTPQAPSTTATLSQSEMPTVRDIPGESQKILPTPESLSTTETDMPTPDMMMRSTAATPTDILVPIEGTSMMTSIAPSPTLDTTPLDTEITDMMSEISSIIHPPTVTIVIPPYPRQMTLYEQGVAFTPAEISSQSGTSLTVRTVDTISDTALLRKKITALTTGDQIVGEGQVIYQEFTRSGIHTLVPVISYTLTSEKVISVSLVAGYE